MSDIELKPCPFCGAEVSMARMTGAYSGGFSFCHHNGTHANGIGGDTFDDHGCVVRRAIVFVNEREAREWADAWNRRADA